jgi:ferritin-like metal-binding protein YciE
MAEGGRASRTIEEQLVKHLADAHSIEEQALTQLRRAPELAGDPKLAAAFEEHLGETERHERLVRSRLEAHDAAPSTIKDIAGKAGGMGMIAFAQVNPDTPGKLTDHAFSYEHMEFAAYELLARVADRAGDAETAETGREIAAEERRMADRLADGFDAAVAASLRDQDPDQLGPQLDGYLADAHAIEQQAISLLEGGQKVADEAGMAALFEEHLAETRGHERRVLDRLEARGSRPSAVKDLGMRLGGLNVGAFFAAQPDTPVKLSGFAYAFEHLEVGGYELLRRVAERAGDADSAQLAITIAAEERAMAERIAARWDEVVDASLEAVGAAPGG